MIHGRLGAWVNEPRNEDGEWTEGSDHSGKTFYHGTSADLKPGDHVNTNYGWAHATTSKVVAAAYARLRGGGHVYEVEPEGPVERDTHVSGIGATSSYRTRHGFRVIRQLEESADDLYFGLGLSKTTGRAAMATDTKKPYGDVTYADPKNGKYPVDTEEHARAAWSYINMPKNADKYPLNGVTLSEVKDRIRAACKKFGIDISDGDSSGSVSRSDLVRFYPLEDIHIIRSSEDAGADGRTVEAYAAVFSQESEIQDQYGHYLEIIEPSAFNRRLDHVKRSRAGLGQIKVLYNHGMTIQGTPSERFSMPVGTPVEIRAESRGLLTRTRYNQTPLADEVLENIRTGGITSQSFVGPPIRSTPSLMRGRFRPDRSGQLTIVRHSELGLRDYGPVVFPAYSGAEILGVRMSLPGERFPAEDDPEAALPPDEGPAPGDPPAPDEGDGHSARYHQHALYRLESQKRREEAGLVW